MKTIFSVCSRIGSIFQIFPLTMNQRPETATLLPSGLVYLLLCFLSKVSTDYFLRLFNVCLLLKQKNWSLWKISTLFLLTYNLLLWRPIVICNRCNVVSSHKCLTYTNQTSCTMSFNRKLIKIFGEKFTGGVLPRILDRGVPKNDTLFKEKTNMWLEDALRVLPA